MLKEAPRTVPIARTIMLQLEQYGESVSEEAISQDRRSPTSEFVNLVYQNQVIEHLGRSTALQVNRWRQGTSSLFFQAAHHAFDEHHAFGLRPEVLMYLVNSVVAETVRRHSDDYRQLFTTETEKVEIEVRHDGLRRGDPMSPWQEAIVLFDSELRKRVPSDVMGQMLPSFTTATTESNVASLVSFMDAANPYYDYTVGTRCGIPRVVLFGEPDDYQKLLVACTELSERFGNHLGSYFDSLLPVLRTIAETANGAEIDEAFWKNIYTFQSSSGTNYMNGWLTAFLWYIHTLDWKSKTNPLVVKPEDSWKCWDGDDWGLPHGSAPTHLSRVPFKWDYFGEDLPMDFIGGVLGVEEEAGAVTPQLSYGVLQRAM